MTRPDGETTADQQPQVYELQPQEYQYDTNYSETNHHQQEVHDPSQATSEISYHDASSGNDTNTRFQQQPPQPQYQSAPPPQPAANQPPYGVAQMPRQAQLPPHQNILQTNPSYQPQQGQNNIAPTQQQQPAVKLPPQQSSPLHPMYHSPSRQQPVTVAFPPAPQGNKFQQPPPHQADADNPNQVPAPVLHGYNISQGQGGYPQTQQQSQGVAFQQQVGVGGVAAGYNNMPASPMKPMPQAAPGVPVQQLQPGPVYNQGWKTGLFDCMDDPLNAIVTFFFPCMTFGRVAEIVDNGHTSCATSALTYGLRAAVTGLPCLMSCGYRSKLRARFGLAESPAPDWVVHCFCDCCALCQEYRELNLRGWDPSIGWQGNIARQNMQQAQVVMTPPMHQNMMASSNITISDLSLIPF